MLAVATLLLLPLALDILGIANLFGDDDDNGPSEPEITDETVILTSTLDFFIGDDDEAEDVSGLGGNDALNGAGGNDILRGGLGSDVLNGGYGDDRMFGGNGDDVLHGKRDDDVLTGGNGDDFLMGGDEDDRLFGGADDDFLEGGEGTDTLFGGSGNDVLTGDNFFDDPQSFKDLRDLRAARLALDELPEVAETPAEGDAPVTDDMTPDMTPEDMVIEPGEVVDPADVVTPVVTEDETPVEGAGDDEVVGDDVVEGETPVAEGEEGAVDTDDVTEEPVTTDVEEADDVVTATFITSDFTDSALAGAPDADLLNGGSGDDTLILGSSDIGIGGTGNDLFSVLAGEARNDAGGPALILDFNADEDTLVFALPDGAEAPEDGASYTQNGDNVEVRIGDDLIAVVADTTTEVLVAADPQFVTNVGQVAL